MVKVRYLTKIWQEATFKEDANVDNLIKTIEEQGVESIFDEELEFIENEIDLFNEDYSATIVEIYDNEDRLVYSNEDVDEGIKEDMFEDIVDNLAVCEVFKIQKDQTFDDLFAFNENHGYYFKDIDTQHLFNSLRENIKNELIEYYE